MEEQSVSINDEFTVGNVMSVLLEVRSKMRQDKNYEMSDFIRDRLKEYGIEIEGKSEKQIQQIAKDKGLDEYSKASAGKIINVLYDKYVEANLRQPTFIIDHPLETSPLAKKHRSSDGHVERFELIIAGMELANAFSELVDPVEQRERFELEQAERDRHGKPVYPLPHKFLSALDHMAPSAGIALGVDRLIMLLTGKTEIDEVVSFTPEDL